MPMVWCSPTVAFASRHLVSEGDWGLSVNLAITELAMRCCWTKDSAELRQ